MVIIATDFMDDVSRRMVDKGWTGAFEPAAVGATTAGTATYSERKGAWRRVGDELKFDLHLAWRGHSGRGPMTVDGLPFPTTSPVPVSVIVGACSSNLVGVRLNIKGQTLVVVGADGHSPQPVPASGEITVSGCYPVSG